MLLAVGGGKWGSRLLGSLLETKLKKRFHSNNKALDFKALK